jgi:hypothetical protein
LTSQGNEFHNRVSDNLDLNSLLYHTAYRGGIILLGISEPFGHWLAPTRLYLPPGPGGNVSCRIYDTRGGVETESELRLSPAVGVAYQGVMRDVDRVVAVYPRVDTTAREALGIDMNPADGWSFFWDDASSKPEGCYLLAAVGMDITSHVGEGMAWMIRTCEEPWLIGDANGSGAIDIDDAVYILEYAFSDGPPPIPDVLVADANSSGYVDIDDVVYLIEYIFGGGPPPGQ